MNFQKKPLVGAGTKALDAHRFKLAVDGFDGVAMGSDEPVIGRCVRAHVFTALDDQPNTGVSEDAGFIMGGDVGFVGDNSPKAPDTCASVSTGRSISSPTS